ncbi:bifunctional 4-hydroxy-2-oxoglutarate aldolase/2-dehydro-3-deoxy-phosphogluconate aldolase [Oleomonas cavernae]|uniref:2-dehydro-3-deoxy-phosphogluconate aldolase n=1 Tax=Oleomonas cavernae TaxID=2320859 RepID=A0A418WHG2_9PROT|nr:bifunctional 4-hydroxy-2-oxoglutarate aldolase/2-dehydro-3-deoxy-phosphogluconate aldolase [Oleomonas cavernae]RJF89428.1 bifunctional 4-hydroxy-2-oxoglutarate aldolase/2-dehydro-3-deoxy-phosphogluconate aldolase [Oleomonas cavernae]
MIEFLQASLDTILNRAPVVPVVVIDDAAQAVPLARALVAGGLTAIEITLRTPAALEAIRAIAAEVPAADVGAGTVLDPAQLAQVRAAGAKFAVSPGATARLLDAAAGEALPLLPGIGTASEAMALIERGYRFAKFFPAEPAGGVPYLSALASPLPQLRFCPTGGITPASAPNYLALPNVVCVGGSWMVTRARIAAADWPAISAAAAQANALGR